MFASCRSLSLVALTLLLAACQWEVANPPDNNSSSSSNYPPPSGSGTGSADSDPGTSSSSTTASCGRSGEASCVTPSSSCGIAVDRWKELMIIHRSVLLDHRAMNDSTDGIWSFRARLEDLAGSAAVAPALAEAWLNQWITVTSVGVDQASVTPRPNVTNVLIDPWPRAASKNLALASAPFRLLAIVNRPDLRQNTLGCEGRAGELRFVYTAEDPSSHVAIPMTVIVEIPYPTTTTRTARAWIDAWHALAQKPFGAEYNDALAALTTEVTTQAPPETWRVRTNEIAFVQANENINNGDSAKTSWELREFALARDASRAPLPYLAQQLLGSTPRIELNNSASLASWAVDNKSQVMDGSYVLPGAFQAGAAPIPDSFFRWSVESGGAMPEDVRHALSMNTCNGCHGGERVTETSLPFQHIAAPDQPSTTTAYYGTPNDGETRLSSYLNDPSGTGDDELGRRESSIEAALCGTCSAMSTPPPSKGSYSP